MNLDGWTWEENTLRASAGLAVTFPIAGSAVAAAPGGGGGGGGAAGRRSRAPREL